MAVSIKDIAEQAGVSPATVSRALRNHRRISKATREHIQRLAREMGYTRSAVARSLVTKRTNIVGLAVAWVSDPFLADLVRGIEDVALDNGYVVTLISFYREPGREREVLHTFRERRFDGVIVKSSFLDTDQQQLIEELGLPIVFVNRPEHGFSASTDNVHGSRLAINHLLELGHTRIGYIAAERGGRTNADRLSTYRQVLQEHDIPAEAGLVTSGNGYPDGGERAMEQLLALRSLPTAIFCYNDLTAIGAARAIRQAGLRVPDDISLIGFDDIEMAAYFDPPLTTVRQPRYALGRQAMGMLIALMQEETPATGVMLEGELVKRASCRPLV